MKRELISIIVPAYNVESYIKITLDSILVQTYSNIEIICVDDGSTDNTLNALKSFATIDSRVKVFSKSNEGVTKAREFGFEHANGEYIGFVDADDIIEPTMFDRLYSNLKEYNADISHCGHEIVWLDGSKECFYNTGRLVQQDKISGIKSLISGSFEPGLCNKLYKRSLLHTLFHRDIMDYSIKMNEDLLMNYYLFKEAEKTVLEDVCLYHYIKREGSATSSGFDKGKKERYIKPLVSFLENSLADSENQEKVLLYRICFVPLHYESFGIFDNKGLHQRSCRSRQAFA